MPLRRHITIKGLSPGLASTASKNSRGAAPIAAKGVGGAFHPKSILIARWKNDRIAADKLPTSAVIKARSKGKPGGTFSAELVCLKVGERADARKIDAPEPPLSAAPQQNDRVRTRQ